LKNRWKRRRERKGGGEILGYQKRRKKALMQTIQFDGKDIKKKGQGKIGQMSLISLNKK
jgi:hypothetical protein